MNRQVIDTEALRASRGEGPGLSEVTAAVAALEAPLDAFVVAAEVCL